MNKALVYKITDLRKFCSKSGLIRLSKVIYGMAKDGTIYKRGGKSYKRDGDCESYMNAVTELHDL